MKPILIFLLAGSLAAFAATEEQVNKRFPAQPGGKLIVDVEFGSIDVKTNNTGEITVDAVRKVTLGSKADEEAYLRDRPITFAQEGGTLTIQSRAAKKVNWNWRSRQRTEGKFTISVPARFDAQLKTSGGSIGVSDLTGAVKANTSGGGLKFVQLHGPVDGHTSGGSVQVSNSEGDLKVNTSGGGIDVSGGSGTLVGITSGGSITVKQFSGPVQVETSGGGIKIEGASGKVKGSTSGGSIAAQFPSKLAEDVKLETSGGSVTVALPADSAFDLDASTSGGRVSSDLPVITSGKPSRTVLKGPVNGGGKAVILRTSGGSIHVRKL